jgi:hypothetical protein
MPEYDFRDNLISLGRFRTPTEGSIALARLEAEGIEAQLGSDSTATWLNYVGADLIGAELFVRQGDLRRAREVLAEVLEPHATPIAGDDDEEDEDWSGEDWADDDDDDSSDEWNEEDEASPTITPLSRAFRAAVIGCIILPPLLNFYSFWLIFKHRLWETQDGWRYYASIVFNMLGFLTGWWFWLAD